MTHLLRPLSKSFYTLSAAKLEFFIDLNKLLGDKTER